ncbi:sodium/glutamate symport carrier protein [Lentisphaera araneosa HTCC2155]|uniref:Sodium/glutamate symporter n=1 Tax=Lentisphaera araneosa HTCC2155 TaxID=313628 RepID=A6DS59_9BACT|nr:sodium/glutamate symporter [Lentisphaera araneosa]EDM25519.1 sodium/glutamate symport carrier protein [Lentisphaera araneosa HTCC2155]
MTSASNQLELAGTQIIVLAIAVLYLGERINKKWKFLERNSIPSPVTGGLIFSLFTACLHYFGDYKVSFDLDLRDTLLLVFFSTIGLNAKIKSLITGGKGLVIMIFACSLFLIVQDILGLIMAYIAGAHPGFGLLGGSISFAGGHGTAIAWGEEATKAGLEGAAEFGLACATFGLVVGGLIGSPIANRLIKKHQLSPKDEKVASANDFSVSSEANSPLHKLTVNDAIGTIFSLGLCLGLGDSVNRYLFTHDIKLPGFLTAMLVGIILTNSADHFKIKMSQPAIDLISGLSLQLFLTMSLMSMDLLSLMESASFLLFIVLGQGLLITLFAVHIVFRLMGKDYDAAVIAGGFMGLGLGATPVAIANMDAIMRKFGHSQKALIIVPLTGAFFIDIMNVLIIKFFIALPIFQAG